MCQNIINSAGGPNNLGGSLVIADGLMALYHEILHQSTVEWVVDIGPIDLYGEQFTTKIEQHFIGNWW